MLLKLSNYGSHELTERIKCIEIASFSKFSVNRLISFWRSQLNSAYRCLHELKLLICSSRHSLQYLWPHLVWTGSFSGKWHMRHWKSSSTASTKSSSWPEGGRYSFEVDSAILKNRRAARTGSYYITGDEWGMKKRAKYEWSAGKQI